MKNLRLLLLLGCAPFAFAADPALSPSEPAAAEAALTPEQRQAGETPDGMIVPEMDSNLSSSTEGVEVP